MSTPRDVDENPPFLRLLDDMYERPSAAVHVKRGEAGWTADGGGGGGGGRDGGPREREGAQNVGLGGRHVRLLNFPRLAETAGKERPS